MNAIDALNESVNESLSNGIYSHTIEGQPRQFAGIDDVLAVLRGEMSLEEAEERLAAFKETPLYIDCDLFIMTKNPDGTFDIKAELILND